VDKNTYPKSILNFLINMATLKITIFKAKILKDGKHKIRIAVRHKQETSYIVTRFIIDSLSQFKDGQVVKRSDASIISMKLRNLLNDYQDKLDKIGNQELYTSSQLKAMLQRKQKDNNSLIRSRTFLISSLSFSVILWLVPLGNIPQSSSS